MSELKIAFGMIIFEGDYVLEACLESIYPYATQILISEGPVSFWQQQGKTTSGDQTNQILESFPDPENKIVVVHGQYDEKDEQSNAYIEHLKDDIDYLWQVDSDEIYKQKDIEKMIDILKEEKYTSVGVKSCSFYGGFDRIIGGFEERVDNFLRIFRVFPQSRWLTHRPPTIEHTGEYKDVEKKHLDSDTLFFKHNIQMYHYSYTFPKQVSDKISYYKAKVSRENCIDFYVDKVYIPWMQAQNADSKFEVENLYHGVHEFKPRVRGEAFTRQFLDKHPASIEKRIPEYKKRIEEEFDNLLLSCKKEAAQIDDKICWLDNDSVPAEMLKGATGVLWPKLIHSDHVHVLSTLLDFCKEETENILDLGCGAAELSSLLTHKWPNKKFNYSGADLPNVIDLVAKKLHPDYEYIKLDVLSDDLNFLNKYDLVVMNAFIDVMQNPLATLLKILKNSSKGVIIHRQRLTKDFTGSKLIDSAYGKQTYSSCISESDLIRILNMCEYKVEKYSHWSSDFYSLLLKKIK